MINDVRELLQAERYGVLATLSARREGWPFASLAPYALADDGEPLLLLSDLAEHSRNLRADPRASLLVSAQSAVGGDPQAAARVTLLGRVEAISGEKLATARQVYAQRHPSSAAYLAMADFRLYRLICIEARLIKGFGEMGWINLQKETA